MTSALLIVYSLYYTSYVDRFDGVARLFYLGETRSRLWLKIPLTTYHGTVLYHLGQFIVVETASDDDLEEYSKPCRIHVNNYIERIRVYRETVMLLPLGYMLMSQAHKERLDG